MNLINHSFEVADVAAIVGISATLAKNWTLGRPLSITPSVRYSAGTGVSNLYSINDVYLMALVNELQKAGVIMSSIKKFLDAFSSLSLELSEAANDGYILVSPAENTVVIRVIDGDVEFVKIIFTPNEKRSPVHHLINLKLLLTQINDRAKELISRQKWDGTYNARVLLNKRGVRKN